MSESYYMEKRREALSRLMAELEKPAIADARENGAIHEEDEFNPWSLFPAVYGSYSQEFDLCAINVLTEIRESDKRRDDLGAEMFREMLCVNEFCDYGTSPRVCFWALDDALLTRLISRWTEWSAQKWGEPDYIRIILDEAADISPEEWENLARAVKPEQSQ